MRFLLLLIITILFISCRKQVDVSIDFYKEYYPINVGSWIEYEVTDINHNSLGSDTAYYFLKELIASEYIDSAGLLSYIIERFWKTDSTSLYQIKDIWTGTITNTSAQKVEENIRYVKMTFPIKRGDYWNGNSYNVLNEWEYEYDSIHESYNINNIYFDSTVKVINRDRYNAIEYENAYEIYSKNLGLIYKKYIDLSINLYNIKDIVEGVELEMRVINYGSN